MSNHKNKSKWIIDFNAKYGDGEYDRLVNLLGQPCNTLQYIGDEFGVTREAVRYWSKIINPGASNRKRRKTCMIKNSRMELFEDDLFRSFYRIAREYFTREEIQPIQSAGRLLKKMVYVKDRKVNLRRAPKLGTVTHKGEKYSYPSGFAFVLQKSNERTDFVFYHLRGNDYIFVPQHMTNSAKVYNGLPESSLQPYRNNFDALLKESVPSSVAHF